MLDATNVFERLQNLPIVQFYTYNTNIVVFMSYQFEKKLTFFPWFHDGEVFIKMFQLLNANKLNRFCTN